MSLGQVVWDGVSPIVTVLAKDVVTAAAAGGVVIYGIVKTKVLSYAKNSYLHKVAEEGFAYAEKVLDVDNPTSQQKYNAAFDYISAKLGKVGIKITSAEIKVLIEKAVLDYNAKTK